MVCRYGSDRGYGDFAAGSWLFARLLLFFDCIRLSVGREAVGVADTSFFFSHNYSLRGVSGRAESAIA